MLLIERICSRHEFLVPSVIPGLVATEEQQSNAAWIKSVQHTNGLSAMLHPQFAHVREARGDNRFAVPIWKRRAELF
jgi:hypothetical protein